WNNFRLAPKPVFDTQVAAMVCGFGDQVSYGQLVKVFANTRLDKNSQIVDWSKRPLLGRHIEYALADVVYLGTVYEKLLEGIRRRKRAGWIEAEMLELSDPKRYVFNPDVQARRLKMRYLKPRQLAMLHKMILWREERAISQNIPRGWVLKDLALRDIISNPPQNRQELGRIRGIGGLAKDQVGEEILECIRKAKNRPLSECPPVETVNTHNQAKDSTMVLLRALLKHVCEQNEVASKLVASRSELEEIALGGANRVSGGWRGEIFGGLANQLLKGQIALTLADGDFEIVKRG
ncbi:MAG: HRDC domain-containing protein, partial [Candidatus Marinimicrobia bacterium]|nr:HRDC domain-containing protein [Candidatus Neomarinimicrobiota bacterium]